MKPFHLDLSKFKKVASDANSTTLQNDQGHQLKVAHKALAPKMRMALEALTPLQADEVHHLNEDTKGMADGGEIEPKAEREGEEQHETIDNFTPGESYDTVAGQRSKDMADFAEGGDVQHYAGGTKDVEPPYADDDDNNQTPADDSSSATTPDNLDLRLKALEARIQKFPPAESAPNTSVDESQAATNPPVTPEVDQVEANRQHLAQTQTLAQNQSDVEKRREQPDLQALAERQASIESGQAQGRPAVQPQVAPPQGQMPNAAATPQTPPVNPPPPPTAGAQGPRPTAPGPEQDAWDLESAAGEGYLNPQKMQALQTAQTLQAGYSLMDQAVLQGKVSQAQAAAIKNDTGAMLGVTDKYNATLDEITNNFRSLQEYVTQHPVNAQRYIQSMSTGSKIATGIGMLLSGLGGNRGNDNSVIKFLNDQIARDIDAQKDDLGRKETMYSENLQRYDHASTAYQVTMAQHQIMLSNHLQQMALSQGGPMAQLKAQQLHAETMQNALKIAHDAAIAQGVFGAQPGANGQQQNAQDPMKILGYYQLTAPEKAKELEPRTIPNIGFATIPVPPDDKVAMSHTPRFLEKLQDLARFTQQHGGVFNGAAAKIPGTEAYNLAQQGQTMAADALGEYRLAKNQGVFKASSNEFDQTLIPNNPMSVFGLVRDLPRYQKALDIARKDYQTALDTYGVTTGPFHNGQKVLAPQAAPTFAPLRPNQVK